MEHDSAELAGQPVDSGLPSRCACCHNTGIVFIPYWNEYQLAHLLGDLNNAVLRYTGPGSSEDPPLFDVATSRFRFYLLGALNHAAYLCSCSHAERFLEAWQARKDDYLAHIKDKLRGRNVTGKKHEDIMQKAEANYPAPPVSYSDTHDHARPPTWAEVQARIDAMVRDVIARHNIQFQYVAPRDYYR